MHHSLFKTRILACSVLLAHPGGDRVLRSSTAQRSQADVAVLIISARKGEFETGFERGGQTREHAVRGGRGDGRLRWSRMDCGS